MLVQLHWQNEAEPSRTEMLMQGEINNQEECDAWFRLCREKIEANAWGERPEGCIPMMCTETSEHFTWAAEPTTRETEGD